MSDSAWNFHINLWHDEQAGYCYKHFVYGTGVAVAMTAGFTTVGGEGEVGLRAPGWGVEALLLDMECR